MSSPRAMSIDATDTDPDSPPRRPASKAPKSTSTAPKKRGLAKPTKRPRSPSTKPKPTSSSTETLYCLCRQPDSGKWMIACDGPCTEWFHGSCVSISESDGDLIDAYYCPTCTTPTQRTTWKRKCRLAECRAPASIAGEVKSKYCCADHGVEFMKREIAVRGELTGGELAALVGGVRSAREFKSLGDRIPSPPPGSLRGTEEEVERGAEIEAEREVLEGRRRRVLETRERYLEVVLERRKRVLEELKAEGGKTENVCGYDERFALDDVEWEEWCQGEEGRRVLEEGLGAERDGMCVKKRCLKHLKWADLLAEEGAVMERLRKERLVQLRQEEKKIRERQKRRAVKDPREGTVEVEE